MNENAKKWKRNNDKYSNSSRNWARVLARKEEKRDKSRTINLLDIKGAVEIKPQDYSKAINTKEFQFVQKPRDGTQNYTSEVIKPSKKGKGLRSKYDLT